MSERAENLRIAPLKRKREFRKNDAKIEQTEEKKTQHTEQRNRWRQKKFAKHK